MTNFAGRKTDFINLGFSDNNMLAKVGNKALHHNIDMLNPKILVIKLDFAFYWLNLRKTKFDCPISNFTRSGKCCMSS